MKLLDYSQIAICRLHSKKWSSKLVFRNFWMRLLQGVTLCDAKITVTNSYKNSLNCFFFINLWQYIKKFNSNNLLICVWFSQALAALKTVLIPGRQMVAQPPPKMIPVLPASSYTQLSMKKSFSFPLIKLKYSRAASSLFQVPALIA